LRVAVLPCLPGCLRASISIAPQLLPFPARPAQGHALAVVQRLSQVHFTHDAHPLLLCGPLPLSGDRLQRLHCTTRLTVNGSALPGSSVCACLCLRAGPSLPLPLSLSHALAPAPPVAFQSDAGRLAGSMQREGRRVEGCQSVCSRMSDGHAPSLVIAPSLSLSSGARVLALLCFRAPVILCYRALDLGGAWAWAVRWWWTVVRCVDPPSPFPPFGSRPSLAASEGRVGW
jgi:hypothetical protein